MDENFLLTYNRASLKMIRNNLQVYAMEAQDDVAQQNYHHSMMKIDDILHNIDDRLKKMEKGV
jgi:hypothetical protein